MYVRKAHPKLSEYGYDVVEFDTGVHHELMVKNDVVEDEVVELIDEYLKTYEEVYPKTKSKKFSDWLEDKVKSRKVVSRSEYIPSA